MATRNKRLWLTLEGSKADAITEAALEYGMPVSSFAGLCAWMGYGVMMRTLKPESAYTPEQQVKMYLAAKAAGIDVKPPNSEEFKTALEAQRDV